MPQGNCNKNIFGLKGVQRDGDNETGQGRLRERGRNREREKKRERKIERKREIERETERGREERERGRE